MTFAVPGYLFALAAAGLPILLHLVRHRKVRIIPWAAWEFLNRSERKLRRRLRIEQLLLVALRVLIVALIVLAFARPVVRAPVVAGANGDPTHMVIALDDSLSMATTREGRTDFARAKEAADKLIARTLKPGDTVSVLLGAGVPRALVKQPSHDLEYARAAIRGCSATALRTDYAALARACLDRVEAGASRRREVYIVTDGQATGFGRLPGENDLWKRLSSAARVTWVLVAPGPRPNAYVADPTFSRAMVTPDTPVRIEADIVNQSEEPMRGDVVRLEVDGRAVGSVAVDAASGRSARASFAYLFESAGPHSGRLVLDRPDNLQTDNAASFAIRVRDGIRVLLVGPPGSGGRPSDTLYLSTALAPTGATERAGSGVTLSVRSEIGTLPPDAFDVVVLAGPSGIGSDAASKLRAYVDKGGGLLAFPSADRDWPAGALVSSGVLPGRYGARRVTSVADAATLDGTTAAHHALAMFRRTEESDISSARLTTTYVLDPGSGDRADRVARIAMRFADGRPAILDAAVGRGRVVQCAFTPGSGGGDLPLKAAYVPLVHQLVAYLAGGRGDERMLRVGRAWQTRLGLAFARSVVSFVGPDGRSSDLRGVVGPEDVAVATPTMLAAGVYRLRADGRTIDTVAANSDPQESDLRAVSDNELRRLTGVTALPVVRSVDGITEAVRAGRHGLELWRYLLTTAIALLCLEALLARLIGRRT